MPDTEEIVATAPAEQPAPEIVAEVAAEPEPAVVEPVVTPDMPDTPHWRNPLAKRT